MVTPVGEKTTQVVTKEREFTSTLQKLAKALLSLHVYKERDEAHQVCDRELYNTHKLYLKSDEEAKLTNKIIKLEGKISLLIRRLSSLTKDFPEIELFISKLAQKKEQYDRTAEEIDDLYRELLDEPKSDTES